MRNFISLALLAISLMAFSNAAYANEAHEPNYEEIIVVGDVEYGEYLASECLACHAPSYESDGIPSIVGWPPEAFVAVLLSYKLKERDNVTMQTVTAGLDDEQMGSLALYFEEIGKKLDSEN